MSNEQQGSDRADHDAWFAAAGDQAQAFDGLTIGEMGVARGYRARRAAAQADAIAEQHARQNTAPPSMRRAGADKTCASAAALAQ